MQKIINELAEPFYLIDGITLKKSGGRHIINIKPTIFVFFCQNRLTLGANVGV